MAEKAKVTTMVLKVDLQCYKCYKKVKKLLCRFPEIQDQVYDEKNNKVTIKVVCCCPEKVRDKLCCKGRESIKSIEILKPPDEKPLPPPPKAADMPPKPKKEEDKKKEGDDPDINEPIRRPTVDSPQVDKTIAKSAKPLKPDLPPPPIATLAPGYPPPLGPVPVGFCTCTDCYQGHGAGPCYNPCYGQPLSLRYYDGYYGRPVYDSWGGGGGYRGYYGKGCGESDENPQGCTIM